MRQVLLVIVLVGAAFGGGALVSGPGFRWAQEHLLDYMGLKDGGEIDTLELTPPPGAAKPGVAEPLAGPAAAKSAPATAAYAGLASGQAGSPYAQAADLNNLRSAYENLRIFSENTAQVLNALINDLRSMGLLG